MAQANPLREYARKRDFSGTPEPGGAAAAQGEAYAFVVQKHDASHLHYDFRLELDGVLKSWAVPKGPCLDPSVKRLAIEVEDHPLDYAHFEGHIPEGHYGAGDVIVWDAGHWRPQGDPHAGLKRGHLKFRLQGSKLTGSWSLIRTRMAGCQPQWFLIKGRDAQARDFPRFDILTEAPLSVLSGQPLPSEAASAARKQPTSGKSGKTRARKTASGKTGRAGLPEHLSPQLATLMVCTDKPARLVVREEPQPARKGKGDAARAHSAAGNGDNRVAGITITHPQRVIDTASGLHKIDVARYYARVADRLLPWLADRPVSLVRAPDGVGGEQFFQRHASRTEIPGVEQLEPGLDPGHAPLLRIGSTRALVGAAQMGVLELHTWNAAIDDLDTPDRFVLDLDPDPTLPWQRMIEATQSTLALLDELGLRAFLKTSGGRGMHILVPVRRSHGWDDLKDFAHAISRHMAKRLPDRFSAISGPKNRVGRIFIDYLRNTRGASTVCVWSVRAREGLPVSVPVARDELANLKGANVWNIQNIEERLARPDPWTDWPKARQQRLNRTMWQALEG